ncbi:MAG TPA: hypothetical protein VIS99_14245 [Terrimicrobiaceae bacterium]
MFHESALSIGESPDQDARSLGVEIDAHDISRFEWRIIIPLPAHKVLKYTIEAIDLGLGPLALGAVAGLHTPG